MLKYITVTKSFRNVILTENDFEGEGGALQTGDWFLGWKLPPVV